MRTPLVEPHHPACVKSQALTHPWSSGGSWCLSGCAIKVSEAGLSSVGHRATPAAKHGVQDTSRRCYLTDYGEGVGGWAARTLCGGQGRPRTPGERPPVGCPHETGDGKWTGDKASSRSLWAVVSRCSQVAVSFTTLPFSVLIVKWGGRGVFNITHPYLGANFSTQPVTPVPWRHPIPRHRLSTDCSVAKI